MNTSKTTTHTLTGFGYSEAAARRDAESRVSFIEYLGVNGRFLGFVEYDAAAIDFHGPAHTTIWVAGKLQHTVRVRARFERVDEQPVVALLALEPDCDGSDCYVATPQMQYVRGLITDDERATATNVWIHRSPCSVVKRIVRATDSRDLTVDRYAHDCPNCGSDSNARAQCPLCELGPHDGACFHADDDRRRAAVAAIELRDAWTALVDAYNAAKRHLDGIDRDRIEAYCDQLFDDTRMLGMQSINEWVEEIETSLIGGAQ